MNRAKISCTFPLILAVLIGCATKPPMAARKPTTVSLGGQVVTDDYWWLRSKQDPNVIRYLKAENSYTDQILKPTEKLQQHLYEEMLHRIRETDESVPYRVGDWWYSVRTEQGKQYPIYLRRKGSPTAAPMVIADVNALAVGLPYFDYSGGEVSPDGNILAFSTDVTGNRQYVLQLKDLRDGKSFPEKITDVESFTWAFDNQQVYYTKEDASKRAYRLYRHTLGTDPRNDHLLYEEKDEEFTVSVSHTRDRQYLVCESESKTQSEVRVLSATAGDTLLLIEPRREKLEYHVDHRNGRFYIRVNDTDVNFRIVTAPDKSPGSKNWSELVAADKSVVIADLDVFAHNLVLSERRQGIPQLAISPLPEKSGDPVKVGWLDLKVIPFDEPDYAVSMAENFEFDPTAIRFDYTSLTTPTRVMEYRPSDGKQMLLKQQYVGGGFNRDNYAEERLFATADDGTKIPVSIVYRKDLGGPANRPRPLLLDGYGSYGIPEDVYFSSTRLSLLDRGVIFAIAHVRGGGEFGRRWYDAGRMTHKVNTFTDFIAAAKMLQTTGWTTPNQTAIEGGSAGGLLIGATINRAPQLFAAAIADVPWVDVLADMSDPSIPLTTLEYIEWGNPNIPVERAVIAGYDPYSNVRPQHYPDLLVRESLNDSQVQYWDAARWVARLRVAKANAGKAGRSELLLKMDMDAGHAGASGRYTELHDAALDDAWLLTRLHVEK